MSFILRRVDNLTLASTNTYIGEEHTVICKERSPEAFKECLKLHPCGNIDTAEKIVTYYGGYKYIHKNEHAYIMTGSGETFDNLTPMIPIQKKTKKYATLDGRSGITKDVDPDNEKISDEDFHLRSLKKFNNITLNNKKDKIVFTNNTENGINEPGILAEIGFKKEITLLLRYYNNFLGIHKGTLAYTLDGKTPVFIGWAQNLNYLNNNIHIRCDLSNDPTVLDSYELITDLPHKKFPIYDKYGESIIQWALLILPHY